MHAIVEPVDLVDRDGEVAARTDRAATGERHAARSTRLARSPGIHAAGIELPEPVLAEVERHRPIRARAKTGSSPAKDSVRAAAPRGRRRKAGRAVSAPGRTGGSEKGRGRRNPKRRAQPADDVAIDPVEAQARASGWRAGFRDRDLGAMANRPPPPRHTGLDRRRAGGSDELSATRKAAFSRFLVTKRSCQRIVQGEFHAIVTIRFRPESCSEQRLHELPHRPAACMHKAPVDAIPQPGLVALRSGRSGSHSAAV